MLRAPRHGLCARSVRYASASEPYFSTTIGRTPALIVKSQRGFSLIEIAIVIVITGSLLGTVIKGQELITSSRVRNVAAQLEGVKIAYLGFQDRYRALPGDYSGALAATNLPGPAGSPTLGCANLVTCANGKIDDTNDNESILAWHQLARAGFLVGNYDGLGTVSSATNAPTNPFGGYLQLIFDNVYSDVCRAGAGTEYQNRRQYSISARCRTGSEA